MLNRIALLIYHEKMRKNIKTNKPHHDDYNIKYNLT